MSTQFESLPETAIERYDRLEQEHRHALERDAANKAADLKIAKVNRSRDRQGTYVWWAVIAGVVLLVGIVFGFFAYRSSLPAKPVAPDNEGARESQCIENGGGWVPADVLDMSDKGMCVFPGKIASQE